MTRTVFVIIHDNGNNLEFCRSEPRQTAAWRRIQECSRKIITGRSPATVVHPPLGNYLQLTGIPSNAPRFKLWKIFHNFTSSKFGGSSSKPPFARQIPPNLEEYPPFGNWPKFWLILFPVNLPEYRRCLARARVAFKFPNALAT